MQILLSNNYTSSCDSVTEWVSDVEYLVSDIVWYKNGIYQCVTNHLSSSSFSNAHKNNLWANISGNIGEIKTTTRPVDKIPIGWLLCDGREVSKIIYGNLFNMIGNTYGTPSNQDVFKLPNFKGRIPVGLDTTQTEFNTLGKTGGAKSHKLTIAETPRHNHAVNTSTTRGQMGSYPNNSIRPDASVATSVTGSDQAHNNLMPYQIFNYVIKY